MNVKSGNTTEKPLISHPTKLVDEPPEGRQTIIVDAVKVSKEDFKRG